VLEGAGHTHWRNDQKFSIVSSVLNARSTGPLTIDDLVHDLTWNGTEEEGPVGAGRTKRFTKMEPAENWSTSENVTRPWREIRKMVKKQVRRRRKEQKARRRAASELPPKETWLVEEEEEEQKETDRAKEKMSTLPYGADDEKEYKLKGRVSRPRNGRVRVPNEVHIVYQAWDLNKWCTAVQEQKAGLLAQIPDITQFQRFEITRKEQVQVVMSQSPLDDKDNKECEQETHRSCAITLEF